MAKKEEKTSTPAYVDYDGGDEIETRRWNVNNVESFWRGTLIKQRRLSAHPWSIKTKSLCKRMLEEFGADALKEMIMWWINKGNTSSATMASFEEFYTKRYEAYDKGRSKDYSEWEY